VKSQIDRSAPILLTLLSIAFLGLTVVNTELSSRLMREDELLQNLQAVLLFAAAFMFAGSAFRAGKADVGKLETAALALLALVAFFVAGEEVSWGQRIFGFQTPESLKAINTQQEFTVHNLAGLQRVRHWALIAFGLIGGLASIPRIRLRARQTAEWIAHLLPERSYVSAFAMAALLGVCIEAITLLSRWGDVSQPVTAARYPISENAELLVAGTVCVYALRQLMRFFGRDASPGVR